MNPGICNASQGIEVAGCYISVYLLSSKPPGFGVGEYSRSLRLRVHLVVSLAHLLLELTEALVDGRLKFSEFVVDFSVQLVEPLIGDNLHHFEQCGSLFVIDECDVLELRHFPFHDSIGLGVVFLEFDDSSKSFFAQCKVRLGGW